MAASTAIVINWPTSFSQGEILARLRKSPGDRRRTIRELFHFAMDTMIGKNAGFWVQHSAEAAVRASQTATLTQASLVDATDTLTTFGVTLTAKTTATTENHFAIGTTNAEAATNLKNAINAHSTLSKYVIATVADSVVTITVLIPGAGFNFCTLAEAGNGIALGGTVYASGAGLKYGTVDAYTW